MITTANELIGRRTRDTWQLVFAVLGCCVGLFATGSLGALAQSGGYASNVQTRSFINPFPSEDIYRVRIFGDSWAEGLLGPMRKVLSEDARLRVERKQEKLQRIVSRNWDKSVTQIEERSPSEAVDIAIVMTGAYDRASLRSPGGGRVRIGSPQWRAGYAARVGRLLKAFADRRIAVYWVGQPITKNTRRSEHARLINEIVREMAIRNRVRFIDTYDSFADENGGYSAYGPDLEGKVRRLRWKDGLHFMTAGYEKIAHFVVRALKRDLRAARSERKVSLLGSQEELAAIRKRKEQPKSRPSSAWDGLLSVFPTRSRPASDTGRSEERRGLKAETTAVEIPVEQGDGSRQRIRLEIERPAIAPAIVDLVTRRASRDNASALGATFELVGPSGRPVLGTLIPTTRSDFAALRAKSAPTQMPFFKVWAKGERLTPKPNRADDNSWPRPQPVVLVGRQETPAEPEPFVDPLAEFERGQRRSEPLWDGPPLPEPNPERY